MSYISVKNEVIRLGYFLKIQEKRAVKPMPCVSLKIILHVSENKSVQLLPMVPIVKAVFSHGFACVIYFFFQ